MGIKPGDVVATILPNTPAQAEAHFGVPAMGGVLNTINTRLDVDTVAYIFAHSEAKMALVDSQFLPLAERLGGLFAGLVDGRREVGIAARSAGSVGPT